MDEKIRSKIKSQLIRISVISVVVLLILITITVGSWLYFTSNIYDRELETFESYKDNSSLFLNERVSFYVGLLGSYKGLFTASQEVNRKEFRDFYNINVYPAIKSVSYIELVKEKDKNFFISNVKNDKSINSGGYPIYDIKPKSTKSEYYPIKFVEPYEENSDLMGFDISSDPDINKIINDFKSNSLTQTSYFQNTVNNELSLNVYIPLYRQSSNELSGVIRAYINPREIIEEVLKYNIPDNVSVSAKLQTNSTPNSFLEVNNESLKNVDKNTLPLILNKTTEILFIDKKWEINYKFFKNNIYSGFSGMTVLHIYITLMVLSIFAFGLINYLAYFSYLTIKRGLLAESVLDESRENLDLRNRALASTLEAIIITDYKNGDNPIVYVNKAFESITGYTFAEVQGQNPRILHGNDNDQEALDILRKAILNKSAAKVTLRNYKKDGTMYYADLSIAPVFDKEGVLTHYIGVQIDATQRIKNDEIIASKTKELNRLNESLVGRELKMIEMKKEIERLKKAQDAIN